MKYILALDQGTTSSRAIVFDKQGNILGKAQQEFPQIYPKPGWVEHDPHDIYGSQVGVIVEALIRANVSATDIAAIGITNQRETTFVWDKNTGKPVYNAIVWQCRRTADYCEKLKEDGLADMIYEKTGLVLDAYFSATKLKWILDNVEGVRARAEKGDLLFGTVDTYIMWQLSRGRIFATDYTNACRTMLFNIHTLTWDDDLLKLFDIPRCMLPEVHPSGYNYGMTDETFIGREIPICSVVGDQQAALFGHLAVEEGDVKNTYGTGCFLLMNTGHKPVKSTNGLVTTLGASLDDKPPYVLEGSVFIGGAINQWLRDEMRMIKQAAETENYAKKVPDTNGVYIVPSFTGLGAPYWDPDARGTITGVTRGTQKEHFIRAALEAIDYQVYDLVNAMQRDANVKIKSLNVDGGASANNFLMQFQADILNATVVRPKVTETTALGACYLAGLCIGYWKDVADIRANIKVDREFQPKMTDERRRELVEGWAKAVRQARCK
ncbi:glycerol kinase [Corallococcus sp. CAG:1435]|uniref:Glycerol kinase n=1 Tax=Candidatus Fimimonas gallinarum TaxID=2840821 RepID=A0A9D1E464_9BACT|nr:glycerol kinase [Corallococcus sp. CAG:1435]HIR66100.1 glycerol kinase GlpK [Candidatus Fimimonas gallinarum]